MSELFPEHHDSGSGSHAAGGKKGGLNGKVFGMPVWAAGGLFALAAILGYYFVKRRQAATSTATATAPSTSALAYDDPNQVDPNSASGETFAEEGYTTPSAVDAYLASNTGGTSGPVGLTPQGLPPPSTNEQWASLAADYLIGQGDDPTLVSNALNDFENGNTLSQAEQAIVDLAIQTFGEPPQGVQAINTTPPAGTPPVSTTSPPPASGPQQISVTGQTLEYGIPALEAAGWTINNVTTGGKTYAQSGYPSSQAQSKITSTQFFTQGVAGQNFANSVDVVASP